MHATDVLALADRRARFSERIRSAAQAARRPVGLAAGPPTSLPRATATGSIPAPRRERIEQPLGAAGQPGTAPSVAALLAVIALYAGESTVVVGVAGAEGAGPGLLSCVADGEYGFSTLIRSTARALADLRPLRDTPPIMLCIRPPFHVPLMSPRPPAPWPRGLTRTASNALPWLRCCAEPRHYWSGEPASQLVPSSCTWRWTPTRHDGSSACRTTPACPPSTLRSPSCTTMLRGATPAGRRSPMPAGA